MYDVAQKGTVFSNMKQNILRRDFMNKQKGVTLLETILVLSLVAIIMIGGLSLYKSSSEKSKANNVIRDIQASIANIRGASGSIKRNSSYMDNAQAYDAGLFPSTFEKDSISYVTHKDLPGVLISFYTEGDAYCNGSYIEMYVYGGPVSKEMCMSLFTSNWGALNNSSNCWGDGVNEMYTDGGAIFHGINYPTVSQAAAACAGGGFINLDLFLAN